MRRLKAVPEQAVDATTQNWIAQVSNDYVMIGWC